MEVAGGGVECRSHLKNYEHFKQAPSTSKSSTISLVSSVPLREPTAQISFVSFALKKKKRKKTIVIIIIQSFREIILLFFRKFLILTEYAKRLHRNRPILVALDCG